MNATATNLRAEQQKIDRSLFGPTLLLLGSALAWLILGDIAQLFSSIQLHTPSFLAGWEWTTHGRLAPVGRDAFVYGWGMNVACAFSFWLMARLSATTLRHGGWPYVATFFWNFGLTLGLIGILNGASTSFGLFEMPRFVVLLLFSSYLLLAVWCVTTFSVRNTENVFASQWYLLGAAFWFPWLFLAAALMLVEQPVQGTVQAVVNSWYLNGIYSLFFVQLALAAIYYFLPKILGKAIYYYHMAPIGFWWFAICSAFSGGTRLLGGPVPVWVSTLGTAANFTIIPAIIIISVNIFGTLAGDRSKAKGSTTMKFIYLSVAGFLGVAILNFLLSLRDFASIVQFTILPEFRDWLTMYGCFSTAMFAAAYFFLPRLTGLSWRSVTLIKIHYYAVIAGFILMAFSGFYGGWIQGGLLNAPSQSFTEISQQMSPWFLIQTIARVALIVGHIAFFINFSWLVCPVNSRGTTAAAVENPSILETSAGDRA